MEYTVVHVLGDVEDLIVQVNNLIKQGWKPTGGIAIDIAEDSLERVDCFCQSMIKN